jgi:hypothetical protein
MLPLENPRFGPGVAITSDVTFGHHPTAVSSRGRPFCLRFHSPTRIRLTIGVCFGQSSSVVFLPSKTLSTATQSRHCLSRDKNRERPVKLRTTVMLCLALALCLYPSADAQEGTRDHLFDQTIAAGEFSTALRIATEQDNTTLRTAQLAQLAAAQADINERTAMVHTLAQQGFGGGGRIGGGGFGGGGLGGGGGGGGQFGQGGAGGGFGNQADFDTLIELITTTIEPDTWEEVGGPGAIDGFPGGVYVDPDGLLQRISKRRVDARVMRADVAGQVTVDGLRKISLPRLERALELQIASGRPLPEELRNVAGLSRVEYVIAYPESGDLIIAGPAAEDPSDGIRLTDLVVVLRTALVEQAPFGCSIDPVTANLAKAQEFLAESARRPIKPSGRKRWLERLRSAVGRQNIRVFGMEPDTLTALTLVEADYHMKLVGMGLEPAPEGVRDYLSTVQLDANGRVPPLEVLRWWFTLDYDAIESSADGLTFHLIGQGARVMSENELLRAGGARQATGRSSARNSEFAESFSEHFNEFVDIYPVYRRLRNIFDLAMASSVIRSNRLTDKVGWQPSLLISQHPAIIQRVVAPQHVETVINHRVLGGRQIVAGVSGGVMAQPALQLSRIRPASDAAALRATQVESQPEEARGANERWWWD